LAYHEDIRRSALTTIDRYQRSSRAPC
jgi:hypothetical protein